MDVSQTNPLLMLIIRRNFYTRSEFEVKTIIRLRILERNFCVGGFKKFCRQKNCHRSMINNICISHMYESHMSHKSMFFKIEPWLITHDHMGFLKFFKVGMCLFLMRIIRFCIHNIEMAFETPFAPGGLHFYFGPSGVKSQTSCEDGLVTR